MTSRWHCSQNRRSRWPKGKRRGADSHAPLGLRLNINLAIAEYHALRDAIQEFTESNQISISGEINAIVNGVLDKAVAEAVQTYIEQTELELKRQRDKNLSFEQNARERAEAASRAKNEFLAALSHELRAPLTAAFGWVQLLREGGIDSATTTKAIDVIE
jgi:signal transduction histidine kinase